MDRFGVLSNKNSPLTDPPMLSNETNWIPPSFSTHENGNPNYSDHYYDGEKGPSRDSPPPYGAAPYGGQSTSSDTNALTEAQKRRNRHTVGFVFFGILLIGAAAAATALIIHYVFITGYYLFSCFAEGICLVGLVLSLSMTEIELRLLILTDCTYM